MRLPDGARLLHIGPHKTGTTAIQAALWSARPALLAHGVRHVGRSRNPTFAVKAFLGQKSGYDETPPPMRDWHALVSEFRRARESRVVVSSEFFAWAEPDAIRRLVDELDAERIRIAVTLRPLVRVIPSMWQQNVQLGTVTPFDAWVESLLAPPGKANQPFWTLERHDALVRRWAEVVGANRVTAIVVDDRDHGFLMRAFEALLGLPPGTLRPVRDQTNRSLTLPEAEAVRAFNAAYKAEGLPRELYARTMRFGAAQLMKLRTPSISERPILVADRFVAQIDAIQREVVAGIRASGVAVVGDLEILTAAVDPGAAASDAWEVAMLEAPMVPAEVTGAMGMALLESTGAIRQAAINKGPFRFAEPIEVARVPTYQLLGALGGRFWRATAGRLVARRPRGRKDDGEGEEIA